MEAAGVGVAALSWLQALSGVLRHQLEVPGEARKVAALGWLQALSGVLHPQLEVPGGARKVGALQVAAGVGRR